MEMMGVTRRKTSAHNVKYHVGIALRNITHGVVARFDT